MPGTVTSAVEVTSISKHGFWLLIDGGELFLAFEDFPWFKHATVEAILRLELTRAEVRWRSSDFAHVPWGLGRVQVKPARAAAGGYDRERGDDRRGGAAGGGQQR